MKSKTKPTKKTKPPARAKRPTPPTVAASVAPTVPAGGKPAAPMPRTRLTPAQKTASELTRYLRLNEKTPYGTRGRKAILSLEQRVRQAAEVEAKPFDGLFRDAAFVAAALQRVRESLASPSPSEPTTEATN